MGMLVNNCIDWGYDIRFHGVFGILKRVWREIQGDSEWHLVSSPLMGTLDLHKGNKSELTTKALEYIGQRDKYNRYSSTQSEVPSMLFA